MPTIYKDKEALIAALVPEGSTVLDVGFWGQGTGPDSPRWVHALLGKRAKELWGIDLEYDEARLPGPPARYARMSAESFSLDKRFDVIFAGDLIEHLPNPGLFLDACRAHLAEGGTLVLTTPNAFNLFNMAEKLTKDEPTVNHDHTCYYNHKTLAHLLDKREWVVAETAYLYTLDLEHKESFKKKALNVLYALLSKVTPKFMETLVIVARPRP